jgi:hypothetical protein
VKEIDTVGFVYIEKMDVDARVKHDKRYSNVRGQTLELKQCEVLQTLTVEVY